MHLEIDVLKKIINYIKKNKRRRKLKKKRKKEMISNDSVRREKSFILWYVIFPFLWSSYLKCVWIPADDANINCCMPACLFIYSSFLFIYLFFTFAAALSLIMNRNFIFNSHMRAQTV